MRFFLYLLVLIYILVQTTCQQRYWFRPKTTINKDSATVEKSFQIVW
ncbi:MAG: hypothetical protein ACK4K9_06400 [Bacteroidia bacterium]